MDYANEIRNFIVSNFLYGDASALKQDTSFLESGIIDSTGILELIMFIESSCGVKVQPEEILPENLDSLNRIVEFVNRKRAAAPQPAS
jgi:acyl carrier protein